MTARANFTTSWLASYMIVSYVCSCTTQLANYITQDVGLVFSLFITWSYYSYTLIETHTSAHAGGL